MFEEFRKISKRNTIIINESLKIPIILSNSTGGRKVSFGGSVYNKKAETVRIINKLLKYAEYNNFGEAKLTDKKYVIGYLNFKAKFKLDNKTENVRIAVQMRKDGKFYYNHEINIVFNSKKDVSQRGH